MANKVELEDQVRKLQGELEEAKQQLAARDAILSRANSDGYLVTTPNRAYTGITAGVRFQDGRGFLPASPAAEVLIQMLEHDFHYDVRPITAAELQELRG